MTAPPADRDDRPPRRLIIMLVALVALVLMGCLGGATFFVYVCLEPWGTGAGTTKFAPVPPPPSTRQE